MGPPGPGCWRRRSCARSRTSSVSCGRDRRAAAWLWRCQASRALLLAKASHGSMQGMAKKRRVFEQGHRRKLRVAVDESPEVEGALVYAACRASLAGSQGLLLYGHEPEPQALDARR